MKRLAQLLDKLYFTYSHKEKLALLKDYFANESDPERGYGTALIAGALDLKHFKRSLILDMVHEYIDPVLLGLSWDYVGDLSDTVALLWPIHHKPQILPNFSEVIAALNGADKTVVKNNLFKFLCQANLVERWVILKIATGELRIGISQRFLKQALADYGSKDIHEIEEVWHAVQPPYTGLFDWLEHKSDKPHLIDSVYFHPVMLSHPLNDKDLLKMDAKHFFAEWKYDGIRIQIVSTHAGKALFSRTGDDISAAFPELLDSINFHAVLDGELLIKKGEIFSSFNDLQQRLRRKKPSKKLIAESPSHVVLYDVLAIDHHDLRGASLQERKDQLAAWFEINNPTHMSLSPLLNFHDSDDLLSLRKKSYEKGQTTIEGLMFKRKTSPYLPGRPKGHWYKWKRDPFLVDAVLMYAQRGQGRRSSYYSDYTFGLWENKKLLTIGKAYFGFTDEELYQLDKWIRQHTIEKFGPVREVAKELVFEIAFDAVWKSNRHKSGYALRFPRINRIRWDKPAKEADEISRLAQLLNDSSNPIDK